MKRFPKEIFVQWFDDAGDKWLFASKTPKDALEADLGEAEAGECVAVYVLHRYVRIKARPPTVEDIK